MSKPQQPEKISVKNNFWKTKTGFYFLTYIGRVIPPNANRNAVITEFHLGQWCECECGTQNFAFEHDFTEIEILLFKY